MNLIIFVIILGIVSVGVQIPFFKFIIRKQKELKAERTRLQRIRSKEITK